MRKEEKDLILKVCYASLLYGITVYVEHDTFYDEREPYKDKISIKSHQILDDFGNNPLSSNLLVRPYLRSMSTITEDEESELSKKYVWNINCGQIEIRYHSDGYWDDDIECPTSEYLDLFDWLIAHHFDYRGLIEKGLALEAPEGMYKLKQ